MKYIIGFVSALVWVFTLVIMFFGGIYFDECELRLNDTYRVSMNDVFKAEGKLWTRPKPFE